MGTAMETALVRARPATPWRRPALRLAIVAGGAMLAVSAALLQPFGTSHLFPAQDGPPIAVIAPLTPLLPAAAPASTAAAIVPTPPSIPAASNKGAPPPRGPLP